MTAVGATTAAAELAAIRVEREPPDTAPADRCGGEPMVQGFRVALPGGAGGRCWLPDRVALQIPGFGGPWVAGQIAARLLLLGEASVAAELERAHGLRLDTAP